MKICEVFVEYPSAALNKPFTYDCNNLMIEKGERVLVPFNHRLVNGFVNNVKEISQKELDDFTYKLSKVKEVIDQKPILNEESFKIANYMAYKYAAPLISCFDCMLPSKLKPKSGNHQIKYDYYVVFVKEEVVKGEKQIEALSYLKDHHKVLRSDFNKKFSCLNSLIDKGIVKLIKEESSKILVNYELSKDKKLTSEQKVAIETIKNHQSQHTFLLHGVTGSGKTEIFLQLARDIINQGKQVLVLVPEISLTPQMVARFSSRFENEVAIYHSALNAQEKYEQYQLVANKKVNILVGTRSAIFMPFDNLGLIVIDEEHDSSYKQDSLPAYHARDIALLRSKHFNCPLLLASATPSLESYARAYKNVYTLIKLNKRIFADLPKVKLIDMKKVVRSDHDYLISDELKEKVNDRLLKHQQIIILLNRRGYSPILRCNDCGDTIKCPHCDLALNYHKSTNKLVCHTCGYESKVNNICPSCGSKNISYMGLGTQKVEEHLNTLFPQGRILRMDADTTRKKGAHKKLLDSFEKHEYDILLGTQMIAKGLDIENVTLVGILNGDALLNRSDYRSSEVMFDLLVQASGRSGRGSEAGEVLIQVYDTTHYAVKCALNQDYETFFKNEMQFRHLCNYPPFTYLSSLILKNTDKPRLLSEMDKLFKGIDETDLKILGPIELLKKKDEFRYRLVIKSKKQELIESIVNDIVLKQLKLKNKSKLEIDMNPMMME